MSPSEDNLKLLYKFAQSEAGVGAICKAGAIPSLVHLLDKDPVSLACQSALMLSKMTGHWASCEAIIRAEALGSLIRLLCREIEDDFLKAVAQTIAQLVPSMSLSLYQDYVDHEDYIGTLRHLVGLVGHGRMEVRLAAAEVIQGISRQGTYRLWDVRSILRREGHGKESTVLDLCHLMLDCRDLSEQESVAAAIAALRGPGCFDREVSEIIRCKIIPPLIRLLDDTCTETAISACRVLRALTDSEDDCWGEDYAILERLTPLLSHADDKIFVEAAWTASMLTWHDPSSPLPDSFTLTTIQRLIRLLHHREERVVVSALRSIADARCLEDLWTDFLLEMADEGGVPHLIDLLRSRNFAVAEAALLVIHRIREDASFPVMRHFLKHGIIESLLHALTSCSSCLFQRILHTFRQFFRFAIPRVVRFLLSLNRPSMELVLSALRGILQAPDLDSTVSDACYLGCETYEMPDPTIPRRLLQLARHTLARHTPDSKSLIDITYVICWCIRDWYQSRKEFRAAGAVSFLTDSRLVDIRLGTGKLVQESLDHLRQCSDVETDSELE